MIEQNKGKFGCNFCSNGKRRLCGQCSSCQVGQEATNSTNSRRASYMGIQKINEGHRHMYRMWTAMIAKKLCDELVVDRSREALEVRGDSEISAQTGYLSQECLRQTLKATLSCCMKYTRTSVSNASRNASNSSCGRHLCCGEAQGSDSNRPMSREVELDTLAPPASCDWRAKS